MATPVSIAVVSRNTPTNLNYIDSLGGTYKWGTGPSGTAASVTYSLQTGASFYALATSEYGPRSSLSEPWVSPAHALSLNQIASIRLALTAWSDVANIQFTEVTDSQTVAGDIRFGNTGHEEVGALAWAYFPWPSARAGDVWFPNSAYSTLDTSTKGTYGYFAYLHEIGHAIGLTHPHDGLVIATPANDSIDVTVMSYKDHVGDANDGPGSSFFPTTPMLNDIAAIQAMYGANMSTRAGDTTYRFGVGERIFQTIWDGGGIDTIDWSNQSSNALINLNAGQWSNVGPTRYNEQEFTNRSLAIAYNVTIENAVGGSGNDTLIGNAASNTLNGGPGQDALFGGDGNDTLDGGTGFDFLDGGSGTDTVDLYSRGAAVYVNLGLASEVWSTFTTDINNGTWYFVADLVDVENVGGTAYADWLVGDARDNVLTARDGNDTLVYTGGFDRFDGGAGADTVDFSPFGAAVSLNLGGAGEAWTRDRADLDTGAWRLIVDLDGIENGIGSAYDDILMGNAANNVLAGREGNDRFVYSGGLDLFHGGGGSDTADFSSFGSALYINLASPTAAWTTDRADTSIGVWRFIADLVSVENVVGTAYVDNLRGDSGHNVLNGFDGNDNLVYTEGFDDLDGGGGRDTADLSTLASALYVNLAGASEAWTTGTSSLASGDWRFIADFSSIENVIGTANDDTLRGDGNDNVLAGRDGNDTLGHTGGFDLLAGGNGVDTADFSAYGSAVSVNLGTPSGAWTTDGPDVSSGVLRSIAELGSIENVIGTEFADMLWGDAGDNVLGGRGGNDVLVYTDGFDILAGDGGNDTADFSPCPTAIYVNLASPTAVWTAGGADMSGGAWRYIAELRTLENVIGTFRADILRGDAGANVLNGRDGNDVLVGGAGADVLAGGEGRDTLVFDNLGNGVDTVTDFELGAGGDTLDLRNVLVATPGAAADFVQVQDIGGNAALAVDADGVGADFVLLVVLQGIGAASTRVDDLLAQGNLVLS